MLSVGDDGHVVQRKLHSLSLSLSLSLSDVRTCCLSDGIEQLAACIMQSQGRVSSSVLTRLCHTMSRRYDAGIEEGLEAAYQGYLARKGVREQAAMAKRARLNDADDDDPARPASDNGHGNDPSPAQAPADSDEEVGHGCNGTFSVKC